jgi:hypothetical protein
MLSYILSPRFKGKIRSTEIKVHFVNLLPLEGFSQHKLRYILVIIRLDAFCVLVGMGRVWSTQVDMYFFCTRWHGMGIFNKC